MVAQAAEVEVELTQEDLPLEGELEADLLRLDLLVELLAQVELLVVLGLQIQMQFLVLWLLALEAAAAGQVLQQQQLVVLEDFRPLEAAEVEQGQAQALAEAVMGRMELL